MNKSRQETNTSSDTCIEIVQGSIVKVCVQCSVSVSVSVPAKVYHWANGDGGFDGQNGSRTATGTETEMLHINKP